MGLMGWGEAEGGAGQAAQAAAITAQSYGLVPPKDRLGGQLAASRPAETRAASIGGARTPASKLGLVPAVQARAAIIAAARVTLATGHLPTHGRVAILKHWGASLQSIERAWARGSLRRRFLDLPGGAPGARGQAGARWLTVRLRFLALNQSSLDCGVATSTRAGGRGTFTEMGFANVGQGMHCCIIIGFSDRFVRPSPGGSAQPSADVVGRPSHRPSRNPPK